MAAILADGPISMDQVRTLQTEWAGKASFLNLAPIWTGEGDAVFRSPKDPTRPYVLARTSDGVLKEAFDHEALSAALGVKALNLANLTVAKGEFRFGWNGEWRAWDDNAKTLTKVDPPASPRPRVLSNSPDGKWRVSIEAGRLLVRAASGGDPVVSTPTGDENQPWAFLSWSPDSKRLAMGRLKPGSRPKMQRVRSVPAEGFRPEVLEQFYELPGDVTDAWTIGMIDVAAQKVIPVDAPVLDFWGPPRISWVNGGAAIRWVQTHRGFQRLRLHEVSASGEHRVLIDESADGKSQLPEETFVHHLSDGRVIWASEKSGFRRLYLVDSAGEWKQITPEGWLVRGTPVVEESRSEVLFSASGRAGGVDPYYVHWLKAPLTGTGFTLLTPEDADHSVDWSPDRSHFVDTFSRVDQAPVHVLRRRDGSLVAELGQADVSRLLLSEWKPPTRYVAKARDGSTDIHGIICFPTWMKDADRLPVVEYVYSGPHGSHTPKRFATFSRMMALAQLGFVVVQSDGMGTNHRGSAFHKVSYKNLGDGGFPDRMAFIKSAADKFPQLDLSKGVGIFGYSAGGYDAARALIAHPDFYSCAVSLCGNHDHRTDKLWWNECWMGYPVGDHYREQSNIENAAKLRGKLLLVAGELDDNVNPHAGTLRFVDALVKANKDFEMFYLPGRDHNLAGWYVDRKIYDFFVRALRT